VKTLLRRGNAGHRKSDDIRTSPEDVNSFILRLEGIYGAEIKKIFRSKTVKIRDIRDNRIISESSPQDILKICVPAGCLDSIFGNFRDVIYHFGIIDLEGVSTEGKLHNYVAMDSTCTINYNIKSQVISFHMKVLSGLTEDQIPDEIVTHESPLKKVKSSRRDILCPVWPAICLNDDALYENHGSNNDVTKIDKYNSLLKWLIHEICKSTCIMELDRALVYATNAEYTILYDVFGLGAKPNRSNLLSHFSCCMSQKRNIISIDNDSNNVIIEIAIDDEIDDDAIEIIENQNDQNELAVEG
jgi:hypothetical protein